jgi:cobalt/nickel transport system permease protein
MAMGVVALFALPSNAMAMHISEGILPAKWAGLWSVAVIPFVVWGLRDLRVRSERAPVYKPLTAMIGAMVFVFSCMAVPIGGSCSHPCGTGLAAILLGAPLTVVLSTVSLLLQALFLAHGGLTTLGGNVMAMGVVGAFTGWTVFRSARWLGIPIWGAAFLAGLLSDWATYAMTSFELASALPGGDLKMFAAIVASFMPTQIPLGIVEGILTAGVYQFIKNRRPSLLECFGVEASKPEDLRETKGR